MSLSMEAIWFVAVFGLCLAGSGMADTDGRWRLVWSDEFDGPAGAGPDPGKWKCETGGDGWGNNELEYYTGRRENAQLDGKGNLVIEARRERFKGREFTSARLNTAGLFSRKWGRFEARISLPTGRGFWPAFWMLGDSAGTAGWPVCGEIDIMEHVGKQPGEVYGTIHGPCYSGMDGLGATCRLPAGDRFSGDFHVFGIEWNPDGIRWFVDGKEYGTHSPSELGERVWVFDAQFFIILNLAVGGGWPGSPDGTTVFPQTMLVDWVRVYENRTPAGPAKVRHPGAAPVIPAVRVPGTIEAEYFDAGGESAGYHDTDSFNQGCRFRMSEGVDIEPCEDIEGGWDIGWTKTGEWLRYTATVTASGRYRLAARVASEGPGGTWHLEVAGRNVTGPMKVPDTGGWQKWWTVSCPGLMLDAGTCVFRLVMDGAGPSGSVGNFNRIELIRD